MRANALFVYSSGGGYPLRVQFELGRRGTLQRLPTPKKQDQYQTSILLPSGFASKNEMATVCVRTKERRQVSR